MTTIFKQAWWVAALCVAVASSTVSCKGNGSAATTDSGTGTGTEPSSSTGTETDAPTQTDSGTATDTGTQEETGSETGTQSQSNTDDTATETVSGSESETVEDTETYETDPEEVTLHGPCGIDNRIGGFEVKLSETKSSVSGQVATGVVPANVPDPDAAVGACQLLRKRHLDCDPPCLGSTTCDTTLECIPYPLNQDLGTVAIRGLNFPLALTPLVPGNRYSATKLEHPIVNPGVVVQMETKTGYLGARELYGIGVEDLVLTDDQWLIEPGQPLSIHWTPATAGARSTVFVSFNIDQHGTSPMRVECSFSDNGQGEVPAQLIDSLVGAGVTGYPSGTATRRTVDSITVEAGCVDFAVTSPRVATVRVEGFTPCDDDNDCPLKNCNEILGLCE